VRKNGNEEAGSSGRNEEQSRRAWRSRWGRHMKRVNFQLPADWHMELKVYAAQQGKAITELLTEHVSN
jgi:hypothetical protein